MIKKLPLIVFFLCNHLLAAQVSESYQNTLMEMIRVSGTEDSFVASVEQIKNIFKAQLNDLSADDWNTIETFINKESFPKLINQLTPIYEKHLSEEDLKVIISFYTIETGKKFAAKTPIIAAESMWVGQQWGIELGQKIQEFVKKK